MIWLVHFPISSITRMERGGEGRGGEGRGREGRRGEGRGGGERVPITVNTSKPQNKFIMVQNGNVKRLTPCKAGELRMF